MFAQSPGLHVKFVQQRSKRCINIARRCHLFPHPRAHRIQAKIFFRFQIQQHRFAVHMTNQYVPRHHYSIQEFHFCKLRHGNFFRDSGRDQSSLHEKRLKRNGYLTLGLRRTAMRIDSRTGTLFSFLIQAINSGVSVSAITTASLEKWFPPALSGWRAMLQPFSDPTIPALRTISLDVAPGEAVALLGANGAGKSTLLRILATLLLPTRGSASLAGHDIVKEDSAVRMQIGYHAGTDQGFYPRLSGRENLRFFGRLNHLTGSLLEAM